VLDIKANIHMGNIILVSSVSLILSILLKLKKALMGISDFPDLKEVMYIRFASWHLKLLGHKTALNSKRLKSVTFTTLKIYFIRMNYFFSDSVLIHRLYFP
jgi:hypothetical protein